MIDDRPDADGGAERDPDGQDGEHSGSRTAGQLAEGERYVVHTCLA
jgi:hypothetical protein